MSPRVLLLLTHQSYRAQAFLDAIGELGLRVTVGSDRAQPVAALNPAGHLALDFDDPRAAIEAALDFDARHPIDLVLAAEDDGVILAASLAESLDLPGSSAEAVMVARDKHYARETWRAAGLPGPRFRRHAIDEDPARVAEAMLAAGPPGGADAGAVPGFPCVIKPLALAASRGVIRADDPAGLEAAWRRLAAILARPEIAATGDRWGRHLLVEDYLPGIELAVEAMLEGGRLHPLAIFDKPDPLEGPFFEETIYLTPSRLPEADQMRILEAVQSAALALGLRQGPIHAELRWNEAGPWMLEIAPRSIGGLCGRSLRFVPARSAARDAGPEAPPAADTDMPTGAISLEQLILRQALGEPAAAWRREPAASGVLMIPIPRAGILRRVEGVEAARAVPGVTELRMTLAPGSAVEPPPEGAQYLGFVFARGETPEQVEAALREAHRRLELTIEPSQGPGGPST